MSRTEEEQECMDGSPAKVSEPYIDIKFQCGPLSANTINGTTIERVLEVLENRLIGFQRGDFRCRENALAITKIQEGRMWLQERAKLRKEQGVEGKDEPHESLC